ncbi:MULTISPECIES: N-acetylmannosamine-6-phosphate 2-epimerase [Paraclostridium]|uniref:N-acetylmannosamine-6-phosphate 2-epimerase n=1 Tax=Paraclostridium TaxID=1849822 RepID=UPI00038DB200|nr:MULTISPECIES: N-acetylmannosamine-6-phosphate 2-epimerase [Paraclostridium]MCU9809972.1 N-acetylmannosamine-6-phosphate 2-epimerase [Paraclostridium sp. AKS46]MDV8112705.1 N-acetylmannosamine-6-phosphate 2-epimerase [Bacillus sp. BAU-SS-2023]EQK38625.1 glycerol-3-phosphate responsive antiterminator family protein [[Clostridium] bifermentans ATCC 19299] [Paraclostridium bifermentans ATCC 19299]MBZ6004639.1 N-acetylmannosamine-6-phosphate 2-epimerase [Paraclostridium bifermentans]MCE9675062.1
MNKGLIVSCQALPDEPLYSSFIMGKMALAAKEGGAVGIRANTVADIKAIKAEVNLPIIGIIKQDYDNMIPYITPTMKEIDALVEENIHVIALDATINQSENFLKEVLNKYPNQKFMADISTIEEGLRAESLGFQFVGTTLVGYTEQSKNMNNFEVLSTLIEKCKIPVIAEGNFDTPEKARKALEMGAYSVVVGSAITRPQLITKRFAEEVNKAL